MNFRKNKNKEKKNKWWTGQGTNTFEADAGKNYKVVSGLMVLLCSGLILIAIAVVLQGTPTLVAQHNSLRPLWIVGLIICGIAFVGIMVSVFLQMAVGKKREAADTEMQNLKLK